MSYGGNEHRGEVTNLANWFLTGTAIVVVGLRIVSRTVFTNKFGIDDALVVFATAVLIAYVSVLSVAISHGYGHHTGEVPPDERIRASYLAVVSSCISVTTFAWPKLAIIALIQNLFPMQVWLRVAFWFGGISLCACSLLLSIFWYAQCTPRAHQWDPTGVPGTCWPATVVGNLSYFVAAYSAFLDLTFATYPLIVVRKLQLPTYKKVFICLALGGGYFASICVFYKFSLLSELNAEAKLDPLFADAPLLVWTTIEAVVNILASSLPTLGHIFHFAKEKTLSTFTKAISTKTNTSSLSSLHKKGRAPSQDEDCLVIGSQANASASTGGRKPLGKKNQIWKDTHTSVTTEQYDLGQLSSKGLRV